MAPDQHRCLAATSLLVVLLLAQQAHALTFSVSRRSGVFFAFAPAMPTANSRFGKGLSLIPSIDAICQTTSPTHPPHTHTNTFQFNAVGTGANKGVRAAIAITINQPLASILTDGVIPTIAPTVTYSLCVFVCLAWFTLR
jgi:hypothetical protein